MTIDLETLFDATARAVDGRLDAALGVRPHDGERERPPRLVEAMRHAALGGGKRLRPLLMIETAKAFGRSDHGVLTAAAALECVHCYSLVHDDLPAMDDDDMRRGRPTVHKAFDEATAILAGDALLTIAFDLIGEEDVHADAGKRLALSRDLARAAGLGGMAGGQMLDLQSENRARSEDEIRTLQSMKTGALIRYATRAGASLADAKPEDVARMTRFGELIGLAFQLADDLLDVEGDSVTLGKTAGKDIAAGKATLVALKGADWTRNALKELVGEADSLLSLLGEDGARLSAIAHFVAERRA